MAKGKLKAKFQAKKAEKKANPKEKKGLIKKVGLAVLTGGASVVASKAVKKIQQKKAEKKANPKPKKQILKKVGKAALAVSTGGVSLLATKKGKQAIKNVTKKLKNVNPIKTLKNVTKAAGNAASFVALAPFMGAMLIALKQKGIHVPKKGNVKEVASLFYINIIQKQHLEHCEHLDNYTSGNVAFNKASSLYQSTSGREHIVGVAAAAAGGIITAILNYFTAKKKLKAQETALAEGTEVEPEEELTEEEKEVVNESEPITTEDEDVINEVNEAQDELAKEVGGEDSEGNLHIPEEEIEEELEHLSKFKRFNKKESALDTIYSNG